MKHLVLDTNVLLHDPKCLENFGDNYVYIPLACIEELDHHKSRQDDVGRNAREVARQLDAYREIGTLSEGVDTSKGGKIFITPKSAQTKKSIHIPTELDLNKVDNQIIEFALSLSQKEGIEDVKVISKDINVRLKCDSLKICSEDYYALRAKSNTDEVYGGVVRLAYEDIQEIYDNSELDVFKSSENFSVVPNTFVVVKNYTTNQSVIVRVLNPELGSYKIIKNADSPMGIKHKNKEQMMALDLLMDPSVHLVTLVGLAGSGKTLMAVAAGLEQVLIKKNYEKLVITRPIEPVGKDIGFLPGTMQEKMAPWVAPIRDNLDYIFSNKVGKKDTKDLKDQKSSRQPRRDGDPEPFSKNPHTAMMVENGTIEIEAVTYIRGRSIPRAFLIIDEAQNLSLHQLKTIITRAGEGTKIVLTGDLTQIDVHTLDELSSGLTHGVEKFKESFISGHITLKKGERSALATLAADLL